MQAAATKGHFGNGNGKGIGAVIAGIEVLAAHGGKSLLCRKQLFYHRPGL
jgi:hypothetical protein